MWGAILYIRQRKTFEAAEVSRLMGACADPREGLIVSAIVELGLRPHEVSRLRAEDVDWQMSTLQVPGRPNAVALPQTTVALLEKYFSDGAPVSLSNRQIQRIVRKVGKRAGLTKPVTPDALRHTWLERSDPHAFQQRTEVPLLHAAAQAAPDVIFVFDDNRRLIDVNDAATNMFGISRNEIVGRPVDEFVAAVPGCTIDTAWNAFISDGEQRGTCLLGADSRQRRFEYRAKAHFLPGYHVSVFRELL